MTRKRIQHPGAEIRARVLDPRGLSVSAGALALGVARPTLSNLLNGNADLTPEMALLIEQKFGVPMEPLLQLQLAYDIARVRAANRHRRAVPIAETTDAAAQEGY